MKNISVTLVNDLIWKTWALSKTYEENNWICSVEKLVWWMSLHTIPVLQTAWKFWNMPHHISYLFPKLSIKSSHLIGHSETYRANDINTISKSFKHIIIFLELRIYIQNFKNFTLIHYTKFLKTLNIPFSFFILKENYLLKLRY